MNRSARTVLFGFGMATLLASPFIVPSPDSKPRTSQTSEELPEELKLAVYANTLCIPPSKDPRSIFTVLNEGKSF